jgi:hypothetical protein
VRRFSFAANWSTDSNAKQHQLVAFYLEAMLSRNEIDDQLTQAAIAKILQKRNADKNRQPKKP